MSRRFNAWNNAPKESFFKTLKVERIYQTRYEAQARLDIVDWIDCLPLSNTKLSPSLHDVPYVKNGQGHAEVPSLT